MRVVRRRSRTSSFPRTYVSGRRIPPATDDYPIATFTWLLLYKKYSDAAKLKALQEFITYGLTDGQKFSSELGYIPLPAAVVEKSKAALASAQ